MWTMGLDKQQQALARLYTDVILRKAFSEDPQDVAVRLGLGPREVEQLSRLSARQLKFFSNSLKHKRLSEACKLLPLSRLALGGQFATIFHRYADTHVPTGTRKHVDDAVAFVKFAKESAHNKHIEPWAMELMHYEVACRTAWDLASWRMMWFRYPVGKLVRFLAHDHGKPLITVQPTIALWFRLARRGRLRHVILSLPWPL